MARTILKGSWAHVRIPGRRVFTAQVLAIHPDGAMDVKDTNGRLRTLPADYFTPANKPKSAR